MSMKSIVLFTSLFMILSSQSNLVRADYSSDDDIEAAESMKAMKPLFDLDQNKVPLSEFEAESAMPGSLLKDYTLMAQEALDKEGIPGLKGVISTALEDDITNEQFGKRIQFSPNEAGTALKESWIQTIEQKLQKLAPYLQSEYYGFEPLD